MLFRHRNYAVFKWEAERPERQRDTAAHHGPGINGTFKPSQPLLIQRPHIQELPVPPGRRLLVLFVKTGQDWPDDPPRLVNLKLTSCVIMQSIKWIMSRLLLVQAKLASLLPTSCLVFLSIGIICYLGWIYCRRTLLINVTLLWRDKMPQNA